MSTPTEQEGPTPIAGEPAQREPGKPVPQLPSEQPPEHHVLFAANDGNTGHEWHAYSHAQLSGTWLIWPS